ncbi:MAG: DUF4199 domain-containing protein [Tannerellaceae bacterium]|jgi:hypothetical protein|nr:DUF4199 domain-containing protein [Tannerellaceae bacterium]
MENKGLLLRSAMFYGLLLGLFWVIKYVFFIGGTTHPSLGIIYWVLSSLTLVFAYVFTKVYKILIGGRIGFFHAWQFGILLYFFAALVVSLLHYVFFSFLAPAGYVDNMIDLAVNMVKEINPQAEVALNQMPAFTPIRLTLQGIMNNVFYGIILSIPIATLLCRGRITFVFPENQENQEQKQ